jgi:hypothetical protein
MRIDRNPALFRAFHALAIDDGGGRTGFSFRQVPALSIERVVETIERAVVRPAAEIAVDRAPRWQVPRQSPLLRVLTGAPSEWKMRSRVAALVSADPSICRDGHRVLAAWTARLRPSRTAGAGR